MVARDGEGDQQRDDAGGQRRSAPEVDVAPGGLGADVGETRQHDQDGDDADRDVHLEHPAPAEVVGDEAAGGGADDRGQSKHATEESGRAAPLVGREKVPNDCEHSREQHTAEQALDAPEDDQLVHVLGQATKRGGDDKTDHPREQEGLASEQVTELAGDRGHRR